MERKITDELLKWKRDSINKPFFLYGPRCVGKTYSTLAFGKKFYKNIAYFNTDKNTELYSLIEKEKVLDKLVSKLSILCGESIFPDDTLIVFDNCNEEKMIKGLKIFGHDNSPYQVIIIGSNRIAITKNRVEEYYYRSMSTMDFFEYLTNTDKVQLIDFIKDSFDNNKPMPFHQMALDVYYEYLITGGFPEVVNAYLDGVSDSEVESIKRKIMDVYRSEYSLYNNGADILKCEDIINALPNCLIRDNKKFQYGVIRKGARSKEYENSINNLVANGILNRSFRLNDVKSSLLSSRDIDSFKLYFNDVGLLYTSLFLNKQKFLMNYEIRRSLIENEVANSLIRLGFNLYYYQSDGKAEISFVIQDRNGKIMPIEVVNMKLTKAKAMSLFTSKYNITECIRLTEENFSKKKGIRFIPVYALCYLKEL